MRLYRNCIETLNGKVEDPVCLRERERMRPLEREKRCVLLQEMSCGEDLSLTCLKLIANTDSIGTISVSYKIEIRHKLTKCCSRLT